MNPIQGQQQAVQLTGPDRLELNPAKAVWEPGPHQFLCKVVVVGLCFSDLKLLKQFSGHVRKSPVVDGIDPAVLAEYPAYVPGDKPTVPGHEPVVEVVTTGSKVKGFKPGERYFIQADWRWLVTANSNGAFGYNFEGALQEYVLLDERIVVSPQGESMLLPAPKGERSASAFGLVEPWACAEYSYRSPERRQLRAGGRMLAVADVEVPSAIMTNLFARFGVPGRLFWVGARPDTRDWPVGATALGSLAEAPAGEFDDIVYFGSDPAVYEQLASKAKTKGLLVVAQCGGSFGRRVQAAMGAVHYRGLRLAGTPGHDPAEAISRIPASGELRPGDVVHVIGAGGPMGVMHVIRDLCMDIPGLTVIAADLSDERLEALGRIAVPAAKANGSVYKAYNSKTTPLQEKVDYAVVMAPVPALVAQAVDQSKPGGIVNIFAGIPADKTGELDLDACIAKGVYLLGTSGSEMTDMKIVLSKVESGRLNTNVSVAAVSGLDGAVDGIRAVERQEIPGKIMVYPACRGLGLTTLAALKVKLPEVAAKLADGVWTLEAEEALLARYG